MKPKNLWALAGMVLLLLGLAYHHYTADRAYTARLQLTTEQLTFRVPGGLAWSVASSADGAIDLTAGEIGQQYSWPGFSYVQLQPGLFLVNANGQRIFVFTKVFLAQPLNAALAVDFSSDWVVLDRSSLLPDRWPEPRYGWIVRNSGTVSKKLVQRSQAAQKPIIKPLSGDTVWIEKPAGGDWQVRLPKAQ